MTDYSKKNSFIFGEKEKLRKFEKDREIKMVALATIFFILSFSKIC